MKKKLQKHLLPVLLVLFVSLFFATHTFAAINYSQSNGTFSFSFDTPDDINPCQDRNFWLINLGYNNQSTEVQSGVHPISTTSVTDSFSIPNGTVIQLIEIWAGNTSEEATSGSCVFVIGNSSDGIFTWQSTIGPSISNILVSNVTSSSVTVSWTTDASSTSVVDYGTTSSYGSTTTGSSDTTSHSVSLTGLSANVTYHYRVTSVGSGGSSSSGDNTFATPQTGSTGTTTTGTSTTTTRTITATPVPTAAPDRTPPAVSIDTDLSKPFLKPPTISGKASDASGIFNVQYSVDDGRNWNNVDEIPNLGKNFVNFTFTPPPLDDDNYQIKVRATDNSLAKNVKDSETATLIIDRLPPSIGGNIIAIGPQVLFPDASGYFLTSKGVSQKITLSAVGGPVRIEIAAYHPDASTSAKTYTLARNRDNGLWSTTLTFDEPGIYQLTGKSIDGAGNVTERLLNKIAVLEPGTITHSASSGQAPINNAQVTLYYFEDKYQIWRIWDGPAYNQKNPVKTNDKGEFSYLVPSGKYYFDIQADGFAHTESEIFTSEGPTVLNPTFAPRPLKLLLNLGLFKLYFPDFSTATIPVKIIIPALPKVQDGLVGQAAPAINLPTTTGGQFNLFSAQGTPLVLTFLNLWSPQTSEQIMALDRLSGTNFKAFAVMLGDNRSKTEIFKNRGEYKTSFIIDSDSSLVEPFQVATLPTHYFIDRRGIIKKIVTGVLNEKEIQDLLLENQ